MSLYSYTVVYQAIPLLVGFWVLSILGLLQVTLPWIQCITNLLGIYVWEWSRCVTWCPLLHNVTLFSKVAFHGGFHFSGFAGLDTLMSHLGSSAVKGFLNSFFCCRIVCLIDLRGLDLFWMPTFVGCYGGITSLVTADTSCSLK
jgi:hypothetical protein